MGNTEEELKRLLYKLISNMFNTQSELEAALSSDLVNVIWQMDYASLPKKEKRKFDHFFLHFFVEKVLLDKTHSIVGLTLKDGTEFEAIGDLIQRYRTENELITDEKDEDL